MKSKIYKYFKTGFVAKLLILVLLITINVGLILAIKEYIKNSPTPIANNVTSSVPFRDRTKPDFDAFNKAVLKSGGLVQTEENIPEKKVDVSKSNKNIDDYDFRFEPISQRITVVDNLSGLPISDAIVWLDGVPRFTGVDGSITTTIDKEYVELMIEKSDYVPYIEFIQVNGNNKVFSIKRPSDDIEIFGAILNFDGDEFNTLISPVYINLDITDVYYAELTVFANVIADEYFILLNGERYFWSDTATFYDLRFDSLMPGDRLSLEIVYEGIVSREQDLLIFITPFEEMPSDDVEIGDIGLGTDDGNTGFFNDMTFNFAAILRIKEIIQKRKDDSNHSFNLDINYNSRTGDLIVQLGYSYEKTFEDEDELKRLEEEINKYEKERESYNQQLDNLNKELAKNSSALKKMENNTNANQADIDKLKNQIESTKNQINENKENSENSKYAKEQNNLKQKKIKQLEHNQKDRDRQVSNIVQQQAKNLISVQDMYSQLDRIKGLIRDDQKKSAQAESGLTIGFDILGVVTYNVRTNSFEDISLSISLSIGYKFKGVFWWVIPMFYEISVKFELKFELQMYDNEHGGWITWEDFFNRLLMSFGLTARGTVGAGINGFLSIGFFAEFSGEFSMYALAHEGDYWYIQHLDKWGHEASIKIGIRAEALLWSDEFGHEWLLSQKEPQRPNFAQSDMSVLSRSFKTTKISDNKIFDNVYQGSKPKLTDINENKTIATWVEDTPSKDRYNSTTLKYAIKENGIWGKAYDVDDNEFADFYHDIIFDGKDFYITWQQATRKFNSNDTITSVGGDFDIVVSKFDFENNKFVQPKKTTTTNTLEFAPQFAIKENITDPISIIWQQNSNNDIFAFSGTNSIYSSSINNGSWSTPKMLYQSENYFSFVSSAYQNGELKTAFIEYSSDDIGESDREVKIISKSNRSVLAKDYNINNTQFAIVDGVSTLFFYYNDEVVFSNDLQNIFMFEDLETGTTGDNFSIVDEDNNLAIFYETIRDNQYTDGYVAILNKSTGEWTTDISLTSESDRVFNIDAYISTDGNMQYIYNVQDENGNTVLSESVKELKSDFEINNISYNASVYDPMVFTISVQNTCDVNLDKFVISILDKNFDIQLEDPVLVGQEGIIQLEFDIDRSLEYIDFVVQSNGIDRTYSLSLVYSMIELSGSIKLVDGEQVFGVDVNNLGYVSTNAILKFYQDGKVVYEEEIFSLAKNSISIEIMIPNLEKDKYIYIELVPEIENLFSNKLLLLTFADSTKPPEVYYPYEDILNGAKWFLI